MGTDIHMFVEAKNEDGDWELVRGQDLDPWYRNYTKKKCMALERDFQYMIDANALPDNLVASDSYTRLVPSFTGEEKEETIYFTEDDKKEIIEYRLEPFIKAEGNYEESQWVYTGRNYNLFSMLADVRNGYGFGGCDTGDALTPIDMPRGIPEDADDEVCTYLANCDIHSSSYFTLQELLDYDWEQLVTNRGYVDPKGYTYYVEHGEPITWFGGHSGKMIITLPNEWMNNYINDITARAAEDPTFDLEQAMDHFTASNGTKVHMVTQIEWTAPYYTEAGFFYTHSIPALKELGDPEDVRIVFGFDN